MPPGLREALLGVGLDHVIAPINLLTVTEPEQILINNDAWADMEFEVALDSGAVVHVCAPADCPGYFSGSVAREPQRPGVSYGRWE